MSILFQLTHLDGAPLLTPNASDQPARPLGESIRLLDAEPVIVINLDHVPFPDAVEACREMLFAKRQEAALVVIDRTHTMNVLSTQPRSAGVTVVDSVIAAAVNAQRMQRRHRDLAEHERDGSRRYRVKRSIA